MNKQKADEWRLSIGGHFSEATALINFDCTIAYGVKSVKRVIFAKRDRNGKINCPLGLCCIQQEARQDS